MSGTTTPERSLLRLGVPLLLNSLLGLITTLLDAFILSHHSKEATASVSIANQILTVPYDLSLLLGVGAVVLITHGLGRTETAQARATATVAIWSNTVLGLLIGLVLWATAPWLVSLVDTPAALVPDTIGYIELIALAMPFNAFLMASVACLRAFSLTRAVMLLGLVAFPSYAVLSAVLVLGAGPIPALGAWGSALATLIVRLASVAVLLVVMTRVLKLSWRVALPLADIAQRIRRMTVLAAPSVLDNVSYGFYQLVLLSFMAGFGVAAVVSRFYAFTLTAFLAVVVMSVSQANEVLVGYEVGEGRMAAVRRRALRSGLVSAALATGLSVLMYLASQPLVGLFTSDVAVHEQVRQLLLLTIFIQPLTGLNTVLFHSLRVAGDGLVPVLYSQVVMWGIAAPLAYVACVSFNQGVAGLWYAFIVEEALKTAVMLWRWRRLAAPAHLEPPATAPPVVKAASPA